MSGEYAFYAPFGMRVPAHWIAVIAQRYLHVYGADPRAFGLGVGGLPEARRDESRGGELWPAHHH